jgi:hypothetical protein
MLSSTEVSDKINKILDEIIEEAKQRCKTGRALRAEYKSEEIEDFINKTQELKNAFNDGWWIPK